jgi:secondary thiamine-phosphate synthase enzyme
MDATTLTVETGSRPRAADITPQIARFAATRGDGLLSVFVPHSTAGLAIIETGSGSDDDFLALLRDLVPKDDSRYRHRHGAAGHGADHLIPGLVSPSLTVPVMAGRMQLGAWQAIVLIDLNADNVVRNVHLGFLRG